MRRVLGSSRVSDGLGALLAAAGHHSVSAYFRVVRALGLWFGVQGIMRYNIL